MRLFNARLKMRKPAFIYKVTEFESASLKPFLPFPVTKPYLYPSPLTLRGCWLRSLRPITFSLYAQGLFALFALLAFSNLVALSHQLNDLF